jgi:cAMP-dependent protein kinase regulator
VPIFGFLEEEEGSTKKIETLSDMFHPKQLPPNTTIYNQGEDGDSLYVIVEGLVEVFAEDPADKKVQSLGALGEKECFGETSIISGLPRLQTVTTVTWVTLVELKKEDFNKFIAIAPELKAPLEMAVQGRVADALSKVPLFASIHENKPWSKLDLLGNLAEYRKCIPNEVIVPEGVPGQALYVLLHGKAIVKTNRRGITKVLRELGSGDSFGEISLLDSTLTTTAEVSALTESLLLKLTIEKFGRFLQIVPELVPEFKKMAEKRLASDVRSLRASSVTSPPGDEDGTPLSPTVVDGKHAGFSIPELPDPSSK